MIQSKLNGAEESLTKKDTYLTSKYMESLQKMEEAIKASELCHFVYGCRWMYISIPDFHRKVQPSSKILKAVYKQSGNRKGLALKISS